MHIPASAASNCIRREHHTMTCLQLGLRLGFQRSEPTSQVDSIFPCSNSLLSMFGQASVKSSLFLPKLWPQTKYARRGKTHKAYPSPSFLWMSDSMINTLIRLPSISECDSGPISASPPLMVPNEGTQDRGHWAFSGFSFHLSWTSLYLRVDGGGVVYFSWKSLGSNSL